MLLRRRYQLIPGHDLPARSGRFRRLQGHARPKPQGGDKTSHGIEAHAEVILEAVPVQPDITLEELRALLAGRGVSVAVSTLWRFFDRRGITLKKRPGMLRSRSVPTS